MIKNMKNMASMVKQAKQMQENVEKAQEVIKQTVIKTELNGVSVTLNGDNKISLIEVSDEIFLEDKDTVLDLITIAINKSQDELLTKKEEILSNATSGFSIPGIL